MLESRGDYFWFGSIFIYKNNQIDLKKKNWNQFKPTGFDSVILEQKPKLNRLVLVRFGYFILKIKIYIFLGFFL
jgi:hypothetical protein